MPGSKLAAKSRYLKKRTDSLLNCARLKEHQHAMASTTHPLISAPMAALSRYIAGALKRRLPLDVAEKGKHLILDTLAALMKAHRIVAADIAKLVVRVDPRSASIVNNRPMPDINMQHMLAVMLLDGTATFHAAHDVKRMRDPRVVAIKQRIELAAMPALTDARPRRQGIVEITTHDGRTLTHRTYAVRGTADNPMSRQEVEDKARDLLAPVLGAKRTQALIETIWNIERLRNARELRPLLRA